MGLPEPERDHGGVDAGVQVRAHILTCMLAAYLTWHLRKTLAPLTYTDEAPPARTNPRRPCHIV